MIGVVCRKVAAPDVGKIVHVAEEIVNHVRMVLRTLSLFCFFADTKLHSQIITRQKNVIFATDVQVAMLCGLPTICSHKILVYNLLKLRTMSFFGSFSGLRVKKFNVFIRKNGQNLRTKNSPNILRIRNSSAHLLF
jgi:hypothetical protein